MKTLTLLLVLLAGQMFGQQNDCYNTHYDYEEAMKRRHKQEQVDSVWTIFIQSKVIELVLEYAEEYYNDSTLDWDVGAVPNYLLKQKDKIFKKDIPLDYNWDNGFTITKVYYYYHKQPTFEGFINWLKERK